jgi:alkylation response protein AidB-like acyl-CoA dehydrogenase
MNRRDEGRAALARWEAEQPASFWDDDAYLRAALARRLPGGRWAAALPALRQAGLDSAGPVNRAAALLDRPEAHPRLERWDAAGQRIEEVRVNPAHHEAGRLVWRSGILAVLREPGNVALHAALYYLFGLNGEVPHLCSVACTAGLVKAIQRSGAPWMRERWLPRLTEADYDRRWHAAQFLTEVQGGSDVGANACVARPLPGEPGAWRLSGEKWFCSNVGADLYAVSARPEGGPEGTAGIGLFVVPRLLDDGRPNGIFIRRLKDKLGTRTLPTAEVDFEDALGWPLGAVEHGFRLMMGVIINTSRLAVAVATSGIMQRAWLEAHRYARLRQAFGQRLVDFPAVRQQLADLRALATGGLGFGLWVAAREDQLGLAGIHPEEDPGFRAGLTLAKVLAASDAATAVHHAIEVLGGNGTIEDLSPLPRLYREVPAQESWEGPHNTLMAQLFRDAVRSKMHAPLLDLARDMLLGVEGPGLGPVRELALGALLEGRARLDALLQADAETASLHARAVFTRLARVVQAAVLLEDAQAAPEIPWLPAAAEWLLKRGAVPGYEPMDDPAYPRLVRSLVPD